MAGKAKYLMIASMDVDPEHEAIFNEVYDQGACAQLEQSAGSCRNHALQARHLDHEYRRRA